MALGIYQTVKRMKEQGIEPGTVFYEGYKGDSGKPRILRWKMTGEGTPDFDIMTPDISREIYDYFVKEFDWGSPNAASSQLSLALIYDATTDKFLALRYHEEFKYIFTAKWGKNWRIDAGQVRSWVYLKENMERMKEADEVFDFMTREQKEK